jgi:hypothetical protein
LDLQDIRDILPCVRRRSSYLRVSWLSSLLANLGGLSFRLNGKFLQLAQTI